MKKLGPLERAYAGKTSDVRLMGHCDWKRTKSRQNLSRQSGSMETSGDDSKGCNEEFTWCEILRTDPLC